MSVEPRRWTARALLGTICPFCGQIIKRTRDVAIRPLLFAHRAPGSHFP